MWKLIPFGEKYEINELGQIRNIKTKKLRKLHFNNRGRGYWDISIQYKNKTKWFFVHRLVAEAFIPKIQGKDFINHKDGDGLNNNVLNLEWCSREENMQHAVHVLGRQLGSHNSHLPRRYTTVILDYKGEIKEFKTIKQCAEYLNVSPGLISHYIAGIIKNPKYKIYLKKDKEAK